MDLKKILEAHAQYLRGKPEGVRANLCRADLCGADLRGANLRRADLCGANLRGADLRGASLSGADLRGASLSGADLSGADLRGASLSGADLRGANLRGANLRWADLSGADLRRAILPSPTSVLLADWGILPPALCTLAMRFDAACHRDPSRFEDWAGGGRCPYLSERFDRAVIFVEDRKHWDSNAPVLRPWDLMVDLIRNKCADSDFHV